MASFLFYLIKNPDMT